MNDQTAPARMTCRRPAARRPTREDVELARLAKAIAHPARTHLLRLLADEQSCVCGDLAGRLPLAQSTVSEHLRILKNAGLIRGRSVGQRTCYVLRPRALSRLKQLVSAL